MHTIYNSEFDNNCTSASEILIIPNIHIKDLKHTPVKCICPFEKRTCLKTRNFVQANEGFQIHM